MNEGSRARLNAPRSDGQTRKNHPSDPPGAVPGGHGFTELFLFILRAERLYERTCEEMRSMSQRLAFKRMKLSANKVRRKRETTYTTAHSQIYVPCLPKSIHGDPKGPTSRQRDALTMRSIPESRFPHTVPCLLDITLNAPLSALVISLPYILLPCP